MKNKKILKEKIQIEKTRLDIEISRERFLQKLQEENHRVISIHQYYVKTLSAVALLVVVIGSTKFYFFNSAQQKISESASIHYEIEDHLNNAYISNIDEVEETEDVNLE